MVQSSVNNSSSFCNNHSLQTFGLGRAIKAKAVPFVQDDSTQDALQAIQGLGLNVEICGSWIWIFEADSSYEAKLKGANFTWSYKRACWYFCPTNNKPRSRRQPWVMEKIRERYGSKIVRA